MSGYDYVTGEIDHALLISAAGLAAAHFEAVRAAEEEAYNARVAAYNARSW